MSAVAGSPCKLGTAVSNDGVAAAYARDDGPVVLSAAHFAMSNLMSRWRAFAIHLAISLLIIGGVAFGLFYLWYPPHLLGFAKADRLFSLIAGVDIIAGPLLTLIVFRAGKPSLRTDLAIVGLLQAVFLAVGIWTMWASRPVFLVGALGHYELVFANQIDEEDLAAGKPGFRSLPWFGATLVGLRRPTEEEQSAIVRDGKQGQSPATMPRFYQAFEESAGYLRGRARGPGTLLDLDAFVSRAALEALQRQRREETEARFLPVASIRGNALFELDGTTARPIRYISMSEE